MIVNPRVRGILFGAVGGLIGWAIAETVVGAPNSMLSTLGFGGLSGAGIAALLGIGQGADAGSSRVLVKAAMIGLLVGLIGGGIGSAIGTTGYKLALGSDTANQSESQDVAAKSDLSMFSSKMRERLEEGNANHGTVQISLAWENLNDLDLHVIDPYGDEIYFESKIAPRSKGELDIDRNVSFLDATAKPVEHIVWKGDSAPFGNYQVFVQHYTKHLLQVDKTDYEVEILVDGDHKTFTGSVDSINNRTVKVYEFNRVKPAPIVTKEVSSFWPTTLARILGWLIFGALVGSAQGATRGSLMGLRNATLGGAIGGTLGGLAFELIAQILVPAGIGDVPSRILGFTILGACIGLFVVLVEQALSAVLKVRNGKFEGRELLIDRLVYSIGSNDSLPGFIGGDDQVRRHHADVETVNRTHFLVARDGDAFINDQKVARQRLANGDAISIGKTRFVYQSRSASKNGSVPTTNRNPTPTPPPPPPGGKKRTTEKPVGKPTVTKPVSSVPPAQKDRVPQITPPPPPPGKKK